MPKTRKTILRVTAPEIVAASTTLLLPSDTDKIIYGNGILRPDMLDIADYGKPYLPDFNVAAQTFALAFAEHGAAPMLPDDIDPESASAHLPVQTDDVPDISEPIPANRALIPYAAPVIASEQAPVAPSVINDRATARAAAAFAVARFYGGASLPFKAAVDLKAKASINFALSRAPTERTAAVIAAILTYCDVQPGSLTFVRGSGRVPGRLLGKTGADAEHLYAAGPESGCLSNNLNINNPAQARIAYVSGPYGGPGAESATFALNYDACRSNLLSFNTKQSDGEHLYSGALALLDLLHATPAAPSEPSA